MGIQSCNNANFANFVCFLKPDCDENGIFFVSLPLPSRMASIPIPDCNGNEKMGIMATGCGVHIVMAMTVEKLSFSVLSVAVAATV